MPASRKAGANCLIICNNFGPSPCIIPCIPSRMSCMAWSPERPNWVMSVLAALMTSRKSVPYTFETLRAIAVIRSASGPLSPVVTVVTCACLLSSELYSAKAFVAAMVPVTAAPMAAV